MNLHTNLDLTEHSRNVRNKGNVNVENNGSNSGIMSGINSGEIHR